MYFRFQSLIFLSSLAIASAYSVEKKEAETQQPSLIGSSARFAPKEGIGLFITGEALYWNGRQGGLEFGLLENNTDPTVLSGHDIKTGGGYNPGFRIGIGDNLCFDQWDTYAYWTSFHMSSQNSVTAKAGQTLNNIETLTAPSAISSASALWKLRLDLIDWELGRDLYLGKAFTFRPHMGARTGWINSSQDVAYLGGTPSQQTLNFNNKFWGIGVRSGFTMRWILGAGFSLLSDASFSLLSGRMQLEMKQKDSGKGSLLNATTDNYQATKPIFDLTLGLQWNWIFSDCVHLGLNAGWEQHFYNNFWQWQNASFAPTPNGDLMMSGWVFGGRLDF